MVRLDHMRLITCIKGAVYILIIPSPIMYNGLSKHDEASEI